VGHDVFLVTYKEEFSNILEGASKVYFLKNILVKRVNCNRYYKNLLYLMQGLVLFYSELVILVKEKPDIIISTGSEIAIPMCYLAKACGKKIIFVESLCRINDLSATGKLVEPIADNFFVQWENLKAKAKRARYVGSIIETFKNNNRKINEDHFPDVFVTVGTAPFPRLTDAIDRISGNLNIKTIMQTGTSKFQASNSECFEFCDYCDIIKLMQDAKIVILHAGVGSVLSALSQNSTLIVVPRQLAYGEVNDNHQSEIASILSQEGVHVCSDIADLQNLVFTLLNDQVGPPILEERRNNASQQLVDAVRMCINEGARDNWVK
jgi:UDP-N-acetylglucosamine transferase subunit ALG13